MKGDINKSQRHHFVPQFYFREWYEPGRSAFWVYSRDPVGKIEKRTRSAKTIGFVEGLYALIPDGLTVRELLLSALETEFFGVIDNAASVVHQKMIKSGIKALSDEDRGIWSLFINSLLERTPSRIREISSKAESIPTESEEIKRLTSSAALRPGLKAIVENIDWPLVARNSTLIGLVRYILDDRFLKYLTEMQWITVDLKKGQDHFLTGDTPVVVNGGADPFPIHLLSIAISPERLLIMHKKSSEFEDDFYGKLTIMHSAVITKQTDKYLVSSRKLLDSDYVKYTKIVEEVLGHSNKLDIWNREERLKK